MYTEICQIYYVGIFNEYLTSKILDISNLGEQSIKLIKSIDNTFAVITILEEEDIIYFKVINC